MKRVEGKSREWAEQRDALVWRICPYLRAGRGDHQCTQCPAWEYPDRDVSPDECEKRMCRALAEEVVSIVIKDLDAHPVIECDLTARDD